MGATETTIDVELAELTGCVLKMKAEGYRLVQISCTLKDGFTLIYSFDKEGYLLSYRVHFAQETEISSISGIYFSAFLYENEMKDLFGVKIANIALDYQGNFYKLSTKTPFNPPSEAAGEAKSE